MSHMSSRTKQANPVTHCILSSTHLPDDRCSYQPTLEQMMRAAVLVAAVLLQAATPAMAGFSFNQPWLTNMFHGGSGPWGNGGDTQAPAAGCKTVVPQNPVNLQTYASGRWYIHQQMATQAGNPNGQWNYCVYAEYTIKSPNNLAVHNFANERGVNDIIHDAQLCATIKDPQNDPGRLAVGPCLVFFEFLDEFIYGPYFIVAYDETEGYALVSGGSPTIPTKDGLCTTQRGFNNSGLWVFSRSNVRNEALIQKVRGIAVSKGFDVDVLEDVQHVGCNYTPSSAPRSLRG